MDVVEKVEDAAREITMDQAKKISRDSSNLKLGEKFTNKNLTTKRSAVGIAASNWKKILGKKSKKNYKLNQGIIL